MSAVAVAAPTTVRCPGCGTDHEAPEVLLEGHDRLIGAPGEFTVVGCDACGLAITQPRLGPDDFTTYYPDDYSAYVPRRDSSSRRFRPGLLLNRLRLETVVRYGPYREVWKRGPGRLLDVGCGSGDLAAVFKDHGFEVSGVEPSEAGARYARGRGLDVHHGTLDDAPWAPGSFDAVIFNHVLEHVGDPADSVARAAALLRPGGLLAIAVPNFGSWHRRLFGSAWFQLDLPRHLQHFDRESLTALVRKAGLRPIAVGAASMRPSLPGSVQYATFGRMRFAGRGFELATWALLPLIALTDFLGEGDCLHLTASH
jgi:2-polyprenyl-3-methyl-5-hydroxy-6-metoxy-1,4-benzoquinol methylase